MNSFNAFPTLSISNLQRESYQLTGINEFCGTNYHHTWYRNQRYDLGLLETPVITAISATSTGVLHLLPIRYKANGTTFGGRHPTIQIITYTNLTGGATSITLVLRMPLVQLSESQPVTLPLGLQFNQASRSSRKCDLFWSKWWKYCLNIGGSPTRNRWLYLPINFCWQDQTMPTINAKH